MELETQTRNATTTNVSFIPIIGSENLIDKFVSNFKESIQLYTSSPFIKACLERNRTI
jgi:hypothetical protein